MTTKDRLADLALLFSSAVDERTALEKDLAAAYASSVVKDSEIIRLKARIAELEAVPQPQPPAPEPEPPVPEPPPPRTAKLTLAVGLNGHSDWAPEVPFLDLMKQARTWLNDWSHDATNSSRALPAQIPSSGVVRTTWDTRAPDIVGHQWEASWEGKDAPSFHGAVVVTTLGLINKAIIKPTGGNFWMQWKGSPGATIDCRNLKIVRADWRPLAIAGAVFNPAFVETYRGLAYVRFMDWQKTNDSPVKTVADRALPSDATYTSWRGVPLEACIDLCNEAGVSGWFNVPHGADDALVEAMATIIRDRLASGLTAYVELSNEVWNGMFQQHGYFAAEGRRLFSATSPNEGNWTLAANAWSKRASEVASIFDRVFGDQKGRLVHVLGVQTENVWLTETQLLPAPLWAKADAAAHAARRRLNLGVTTYFGNDFGKDVGRRSGIIAAYRQSPQAAADYLQRWLDNSGELAKVEGWIRGQKAQADKHGVGILLYEGGPHIQHGGTPEHGNAEYMAAVRAHHESAHMARNAERQFAFWKNVGNGPFLQFVYYSEPSKWGIWGLGYRPGHLAPYGRRALELAAATPRWW